MTQDKFKYALTFIQKLSEGKKNFDGIDLRGTVLDKLVAYKGSSLKGGLFQECRLASAVMSGCILKSAKFDSADLTEAVMSESDCWRATFQGADLSRCNFSRSRLRDASLRKANLQGANFQQSDLRGADFRGSNLSQAEFRGAFYDDNTLFDSGVKPTRLGMRKVSQEKSDSAASSASSASKTQSQENVIMYRGVPVQKKSNGEMSAAANAAPKKEVMYRGSLMQTTETPETTSRAVPKKEMMYRGSRLNATAALEIPSEAADEAPETTSKPESLQAKISSKIAGLLKREVEC